MSFPTTRRQLAAQGYRWVSDGNCAACGAFVRWYRTPSGYRVPLEPMPKDSSPVHMHARTCEKGK